MLSNVDFGSNVEDGFIKEYLFSPCYISDTDTIDIRDTKKR